ncbi:MAG: hypothetical protein AB7G47_19870 [Mycolicibacterium sp.]|uniref:hypothetical protein n=1 Tax=Mycolicibacterium sp. TaxID=2320850 RepID=UPI003D0A63DE
MPTIEPLLPDDLGQVYLTSPTGIRCVISAADVCCQNDHFTATPSIDGRPANGVRFTSAGELTWTLGDLGNIPAIELDSTYTYTALGWTITTTPAGDTVFIAHDQGTAALIVSAATAGTHAHPRPT